MTGKTWHVAIGQQPQVVTEALSQPVPASNPLSIGDITPSDAK
ncbi:hypothetical protein [Lacipirellula limnantheis]|nr:hypothetical protein [Lacipirellula limnantheis]